MIAGTNYGPKENGADTVGKLPIPGYKDKAVLKEKYVEKGLSIAQIADLHQSSKSSLRKYLLKYDIPIRSSHKHHCSPSQARYGYRKQKEKRAIIHKTEQRIIDAVRGMHKLC